MTTTFFELPIGARFEFRGRRYEKLALSMARDEDRCGNIFQYECQVLWDRRPGEQPLPPRTPDPKQWHEYLTPAPRPRQGPVPRHAAPALNSQPSTIH